MSATSRRPRSMSAVHYNVAPIGARARLACGVRGVALRSHRLPSEVTCRTCQRAARLVPAHFKVSELLAGRAYRNFTDGQLYRFDGQSWWAAWLVAAAEADK